MQVLRYFGDLSSRHDTIRLSRTPGEPSGCYPSPARRRPALLLFEQGAGTQGTTPLSGPPPSAHNGERGGGVTPRAMAARPRPRHPPRRWRALGRTEEPSWSRRVTHSWLFFCDERTEVWLHLGGGRDGRQRGLLATKAGYTHGERRAMSYDGVGHDEDEGQLRRCTN